MRVVRRERGEGRVGVLHFIEYGSACRRHTPAHNFVAQTNKYMEYFN